MNKMRLFILFLILIPVLVVLKMVWAVSSSHPYFIKHLQVSKSGQYLLAGRLDNKVVVWDIFNKKEIYAWGATEEKFFSWQAHFTADEKHVVIQQDNFDLWFINLKTGKLDQIYPLPSQVTTIAFYKDGKRFIWGGLDGRIQYEDMEKKESKVLKVPLPDQPNMHAGFSKSISQILLSPDEKYFVSATSYQEAYDDYKETNEPFYYDKKFDLWFIKHININLWDAQTLQKIHRLKGEQLNIRVWVSFSPDSKTVYASTANGYAYAWNCSTGEKKYQFEGRGAYDGTGTLLDNHYYCGLGVNPPYIRLMATADGKFIKEIPFSNSMPVFGQMITHDATNMVFIGTEDGSVSMYKFDPEKLELKLYWHPKAVKRGIVTWIGPHHFLDKTPEQAAEMRVKYIQKQQALGFGEKDKRESELPLSK